MEIVERIESSDCEEQIHDDDKLMNSIILVISFHSLIINGGNGLVLNVSRVYCCQVWCKIIDVCSFPELLPEISLILLLLLKGLQNLFLQILNVP